MMLVPHSVLSLHHVI